jgi:putative ABC transport system permease protein
MSLSSALGLVQTALELGLISSLTVLALFLSYSMLNVCDLSTDGCFTLGAVVGAAVAISGHPYPPRCSPAWRPALLRPFCRPKWA